MLGEKQETDSTGFPNVKSYPSLQPEPVTAAGGVNTMKVIKAAIKSNEEKRIIGL